MNRMKSFLLLALVVAMVPGCSSSRKRMTAEERAAWIKKYMETDDGAPKVGEMAPTFTLASLDGSSHTDLASFRGEKPVLLLFGSYT